MSSFEKTECRLRDHQFSDRFFERSVHFYVLSMKDSFLLWVGETPPKLSNLAVAIPTKFDTTPASSMLMGDKLDATSSDMAQRLAKKTKKQAFISYNLPTFDLQMLSLIEKRIMTEMKSFPDKF